MTNTNRDPLDFSDLEGDLNETAPRANKPGTLLWTNPCPKCRGTGIYSAPSTYGQRCFMCNGTGRLTFKTSPEQRERAKAKAAERKVKKAETNWTDFVTAHPDLAGWMERNPTFSFAVSLKEAVMKFGSLTSNQIAAIYRCMEKEAARQVAKVAKVEQAKSVDASKIVQVFANASANGLKKPKLRVGELTLQLASAHSRNAGSVYVKRGETYLGKITEGTYHPSREAVATDITLIEEASKDPLALAIAYGKRTGSCSCCGRELTDPVSVSRGIGPICESKFF